MAAPSLSHRGTLNFNRMDDSILLKEYRLKAWLTSVPEPQSTQKSADSFVVESARLEAPPAAEFLPSHFGLPDELVIATSPKLSVWRYLVPALFLAGSLYGLWRLKRARTSEGTVP